MMFAAGRSLLPVNAEPEGVFGQHIALLNRNAELFAAKDTAALSADLTDDYIHIDLLGVKKNKAQEIEETKRLFAAAMHLSETSQPSRLTVQGGDANSPTVATSLVETRRSADVPGPDGKLQRLTWDTVNTETRVLTAAGWKCRQRTQLKSQVLKDGAPYQPDRPAEAARAAGAIQRAYNELARDLNGGDSKGLKGVLDGAFRSTELDSKPLQVGEWIDDVERKQKEDLRSETDFEIENLTVKAGSAIVNCHRSTLRQTPDKEGVIRTTRSTDSLRDTWNERDGRWVLSSSETLLSEQAVVLPLKAAGWK